MIRESTLKEDLHSSVILYCQKIIPRSPRAAIHFPYDLRKLIICEFYLSTITI